jgi:gluconate 2-dehydrogenase subunit 3-like protein
MSDTNEKAKGVPRRVALKVLGTVPMALAATGLEAAPPAAQKVRVVPVPLTPKRRFFTEHEWKTAGTLADMIIPRDAKSGSATEAGVVEFMDEWVDYWGERIQAQMRGGLMWLDAECTDRFDKRFLECTDAQRRQVLDMIAYPTKQPAVMPGQPTQQRQEAGATSTYPQGPPPQKPPEGGPPAQSPAPEEGTFYSQGVSFFTLFRDLTASGFFTSEMGIKDIGFMGNQPYDWKGCPPEVLAKLGLA